MIAIIISACLVSDPAVCRDHRIPLDSGIDTRHCVLHAPPHFAKWSQEHPGWIIKRWRCVPADVNDI